MTKDVTEATSDLIKAAKTGFASGNSQTDATDATPGRRYVVSVGTSEMTPLMASDYVRKVKKAFKKQNFFNPNDKVVFVGTAHTGFLNIDEV